MSAPVVVSVVPASAAARSGIRAGDEIRSIDGQVPRDVIEYRVLTDEEDFELELGRGGLSLSAEVTKRPGEPLGIEVSSSLFDQVRTCDNHCEFCFIYQLPPGMRKSLYLKDDDYRLSFLYGNFTTLTRFTELDLERVITDGLSPLNVSIHATDPTVRSEMLRNRRGATSLRWLAALLDHGVTVHGQIVVCPGINDGAVLEDTLCGVLDRYSGLTSLAVVPLGVSRYGDEPRMRPHTMIEAQDVVATVRRWQQTYLELLGRRLVYAADEYYLLADQPFPPADHYGDFEMYEDGIGMARLFEAEFHGDRREGSGPTAGFFASVDGAPAEGYRSVRSGDAPGRPIRLRPRRDAPVAVLTSAYGSRVIAPLIDTLNRSDVRVIEVENRFFGGTVSVAGLLVGEDLQRALGEEPAGHRYLLPDVCLSEGRFLDGLTPDDLPHPVEIVATDGVALRHAIGAPA